MIAALLVSVLALSCTREYDFSRARSQPGTLGQEVHAILLKDAPRAAYKGDRKEALLLEEEQRFVQSVDAIAPRGELPLLDALLQGTLHLIDSGLLPDLSRKGAELLRLASLDQPLLQALTDVRFISPTSFVSPISAPDVLGYLTTYPELRQLGIRGTRIVLDNDGFTDEGKPDIDESNGVTELMRTLATALQEIESEQIGEPLAILVRDLLIKEDPRYAPRDPTRPLYVALYDERGLPMANPDIASPIFDDLDQDGLPDVNSANDFILKAGGTLPKEPFSTEMTASSDAFGRSKVNGEFPFQYIDLNNTAIAYLIREYARLSEVGAAADLLATFRHIMGPTTIHSDARGAFQGFRADNPLMDMSWGLSRALSYAALPELLSACATFMEESSSELAGVVFSLTQAVEIAQNYPEAELANTQTILNDMIPPLRAIAEDRELWHDFMDALGDPVTPRVGDAMVQLMSYQNTRATVTLGGPYDRCFQQCKATHTIGTNARFDCVRACPSGEVFKKPMDHSLPESPETRSQLQAIWHLMWSLAGVPYAMEMDEIRIGDNTPPSPPPLIALPAGAEAFLKSVAGNLDLADAVPPELLSGDELGPILNAFGVDNGNIAGVVEILSELFGVTLSRKPTPDQLTRMFTQEDIAYREGSILIDVREPRDAEGYKLADNLADSLFEAEASGMIDAVYPMARAFSDHDKEHLLLDLFAVIHKHYPENPDVYLQANHTVSPSQAANLRSYEPVMRDVLIEGKLLKSLHDLSITLQRLEASIGLDLNEQLRLFILHVTRPNNFTTRDGQDFINLPDGRTQRDLSPLHVLVHSMSKITVAVSEDEEAMARFERALRAIVDLVLGAEWPTNQRPRFKTDATIALASDTLDFLADFTAKKRDDGTFYTWIEQDIYLTLEDLWTSRLLAGLVLIAEQILEEPENRATIDDFIAYLVGTPRGREHTTVFAYQLLMQSVNTDVWLPIAQTLSRLLDPDRTWQTTVKNDYAKMPLTSEGALMLHHIMLDDEQGTGIALMNRALFKRSTDKAPIFAIVEIFAEYLRLEPGSRAPLTTQDYAFIFEQVAAWLEDDAHGLEQVYDLVGLRAK